MPPSIDQARIREPMVHEIQPTLTRRVVIGEDLIQLGFAAPKVRTDRFWVARSSRGDVSHR